MIFLNTPEPQPGGWGIFQTFWSNPNLVGGANLSILSETSELYLFCIVFLASRPETDCSHRPLPLCGIKFTYWQRRDLGAVSVSHFTRLARQVDRLGYCNLFVDDGDNSLLKYRISVLSLLLSHLSLSLTWQVFYLVSLFSKYWLTFSTLQHCRYVCAVLGIFITKRQHGILYITLTVRRRAKYRFTGI